jgi:hemerythrin
MDAQLANIGWTTKIQTVKAEIGSIGWNKELETGIDLIDKQHRRYVSLLSDYFVKVSKYTETDEKIDQLTESFDFLRNYTEEHFATEESIMRDADYPDYYAHQDEHLYFLRHIGDLYHEMKTEGFSTGLSREVDFYTVEWFIEHILLADMRLVEFINNRH